MWLFLSLMARADVVELSTGATLQGALVQFEVDGACIIDVEEGELAGARVELPCVRVAVFRRPAAEVPALAVPLVIEEETLGEELPGDPESVGDDSGPETQPVGEAAEPETSDDALAEAPSDASPGDGAPEEGPVSLKEAWEQLKQGRLPGGKR